jgi:hypothetical protein
MNEAEKAFQAWDNHMRDCKATVLDKPKGEDGGGAARIMPHPCVYDGDKCPRGMKLYLAWLKAIGSLTPERRTQFVDAVEGRRPGGS